MTPVNRPFQLTPLCIFGISFLAQQFFVPISCVWSVLNLTVLSTLKSYIEKNFEAIFVLTVLVAVALINYFIPHKVAFLDFYYIPVLLSAFYLGKRNTFYGSVLCVFLVVIFIFIKPDSFYVGETKFDLFFNISTWAWFLILTGILFGTLQEKFYKEQLTTLKFNEQISIGERIQKELLLGVPPRKMEGIEIDAVTIASQRIDGDFYDFYQHDKGILDILIGDVMGKGIPAALLGAATKSYFPRAFMHIQAASENRLPQPEKIISDVHTNIVENLANLESFVTLIYARFDLPNSIMSFVDCGHTETLHFQASTGEIHMLKGDSMPLGFSDFETYEQQNVPISPGDIMLFYSDGVTDAENQEGEYFGVDRLSDNMKQARDSSPTDLLDYLIKQIDAFCDGQNYSDDLTMVAVRIAEMNR